MNRLDWAQKKYAVKQYQIPEPMFIHKEPYPSS